MPMKSAAAVPLAALAVAACSNTKEIAAPVEPLDRLNNIVGKVDSVLIPRLHVGGSDGAGFHYGCFPHGCGGVGQGFLYAGASREDIVLSESAQVGLYDGGRFFGHSGHDDFDQAPIRLDGRLFGPDMAALALRPAARTPAPTRRPARRSTCRARQGPTPASTPVSTARTTRKSPESSARTR